MNQLEAVNAAADFIEKNPKLYDFMECIIPEDAKDCACALGFIGRAFELTGDVGSAARMLGYLGASRFYRDVERIGEIGTSFSFATPRELVPALRRYAIVKFGHQEAGSPRSVGIVATVTDISERRAA